MRIGARTKLAGLLIAGVTLALGTVATATVVASADQPPGPKAGKENTNSTDYWEKYLEGKGYDDVTCEKYEPVATPYVVPPGDWVLLVLKAGSDDNQNALTWDPVPGTGYDHPSDKDISHAILCSGTPGPSPSPTPTPTPSEPPEPTPTPSESSTPPGPSETPTPPPASSEPPTPPASSEPPSGTPTPPSESPAPSETPTPTATPPKPRPGFGTGTDGGEAWPLLAGLGVIGTGVAGTGLTLLLKRIRRH